MLKAALASLVVESFEPVCRIEVASPQGHRGDSQPLAFAKLYLKVKAEERLSNGPEGAPAVAPALLQAMQPIAYAVPPGSFRIFFTTLNLDAQQIWCMFAFIYHHHPCVEYVYFMISEKLFCRSAHTHNRTHCPRKSKPAAAKTWDIGIGNHGITPAPACKAPADPGMRGFSIPRRGLPASMQRRPRRQTCPLAGRVNGCLFELFG